MWAPGSCWHRRKEEAQAELRLSWAPGAAAPVSLPALDSGVFTEALAGR